MQRSKKSFLSARANALLKRGHLGNPACRNPSMAAARLRHLAGCVQVRKLLDLRSITVVH